MNPNEILSLLGVPAVLLPIRKGTKAPTRSKWQKLTFASTQTPAYQRSLSNAFAIGVSLGEASQNLCSIDFDDDSALETFLALNPLLKSTLRTRGQRGANLWIIIEGPLPRSQMMKNGESSAIGEWRANGCHTIITGRHKDGGNYETLVKAPPQTLGFLNISWPPNWVTPPSPPPPSSEISISSKNSAVSKLSMPNKMRSKTDSFAQRVKNAQAASDNLNKTRHFATFCDILRKTHRPCFLAPTRPTQRPSHQDCHPPLSCRRQETGSRIIPHFPSFEPRHLPRPSRTTPIRSSSSPPYSHRRLPIKTHHFGTRNLSTASQSSRRRLPHPPRPRSPRVSTMSPSGVLHFPCRPRLPSRRPQDQRWTHPSFPHQPWSDRSHHRRTKENRRPKRKSHPLQMGEWNPLVNQIGAENFTLTVSFRYEVLQRPETISSYSS